jgi:hypothetical protein
MALINVNGTPTAYNNVTVYIDGEEIEINGYIMGIDYDTGTSSEHLQTCTPNGVAKLINPINYAPSGSIRFAPGEFANFYALMNNRFTPFTLTFLEFTTGHQGGSAHSLTIKNALYAGSSGSMSPQQVASTKVFRFNATEILE